MSVTEYKLEVHKRDQMSKGELKHLRAEGKIPGIYYSQGSTNSLPFYIDKGEIHNIKKSGARLLKISVGGELRTVIFKSIQYHPVTDGIMHIDLYGVRMDEAIHINIPVHASGIPIGVTEEGGKISQPMTEIEVSCLPGDIPEAIEVDIASMHMNDSLHARDLAMPEKVELVTPEDAVVIIISHGVRASDTIAHEELEEEDVSFEEGEQDEEEGDS